MMEGVLEKLQVERYESYKDSGVDWLGEVPRHWEVRTNRSLFEERNEAGKDSLQILSVSIHTAVSSEEVNEVENIRGKIRIEDKSSYKLVYPNDVVFNMMRAWQGAIGVVRVTGMVSPAYIVAKPKNGLSGEFFEYLYRTEAFIQQMDRYSKGITDFRKRLYWNEFKQLRTILPPIEEQTAIVNFLDHKTAQIDKAIAQKESIIELLKEHRQIQIHKAITRGLDPDVLMKDSGAEWIGEIPGHWKVKRLKYVCFLQRGHDLSKEQFKEGEIPVYGSNGIIGFHNQGTTKAPCITVGRSGSVGIVNFIEKDFWAHNTSLYVKENYGNNWRFLFYLLQDIDIKVIGNGSAVPTLDRKNVHQIYVAEPPKEEQGVVGKYLDELFEKFSNAISSKEKEISKLKEYKSTLINAAVTGKIKVY